MKIDLKFYGPYCENIAALAVPTEGAYVGVGASRALASLNAIDEYRLVDPVKAHKVAKLVDAQRPANAEAIEGDERCQVYCTVVIHD